MTSCAHDDDAESNKGTLAGDVTDIFLARGRVFKYSLDVCLI